MVMAADAALSPGELERHLGDGVIEAAVAAALEAGRLKKRQRRRVISYSTCPRRR